MELTNKVIRIKDIAVKARVSTGTVDRVIHNRGGVSLKVKERVLKIIKDTNYEPNYSARALGTKKTYIIAALIPDYPNESYWFESKLGIEQAEKDLKQYGVIVSLFLFNQDDSMSYIEQARRVSKLRPDGVIVSPLFYKETLPFFEEWNALKIPFVIFNTQINEYNPLSYIGQDSYQSGLLAAGLMHYGQDEPCTLLVAHINADLSNSRHLIKKEQGFKSYFIQNNLSQKFAVNSVTLQGNDSSSFTKQMDDVLENSDNLKGIYVTTSRSYMIAKYLEQRHITSIKIIGYDLIPANVHFLNKKIISFLINQNPKGQGYWSIHHLVDHLIFKKEVPEIKYLPLDVVTKENVNYYLGND